MLLFKVSTFCRMNLKQTKKRLQIHFFHHQYGNFISDISCFDLVSITKNQSIDLTILTLLGVQCTLYI